MVNHDMISIKLVLIGGGSGEFSGTGQFFLVRVCCDDGLDEVRLDDIVDGVPVLRDMA